MFLENILLYVLDSGTYFLMQCFEKIFCFRNILSSCKEKCNRKLKLGIHVCRGMMSTDSIQLCKSMAWGTNVWEGYFQRNIFASTKWRDNES